MDKQVTLLLEELLGVAETACHRYTLVFTGEPDWCYAQGQQAVDELATADVLWISQHEFPVGQTYTGSRAQHYLGMEFQAVIFDVYSGFDPDLFAAISGTIKGGGLLILLGPTLGQWQTFADPQKVRLAIWPYQSSDISGRFLGFVSRTIKQANGVVVIEQNQPLPSIPQNVQSESDLRNSEQWNVEFPYRSKDQQLAVQAILHVVSGHRHRPLVVTSDRGRGKSAALGIAAARLMEQGVEAIVVTAPRLSAVSPVFDCAQSLLPGSQRLKGKLLLKEASLVFVPPDELLRRHYQCNLLLVDEAAAIPTTLLESYLKHYARIVFSTTIHGYEGTGRGFALRFQDKLNQYTPGWRSLSLQTPIRWAEQDPLESLVFKTLLLDADPAADELAGQTDVALCQVEKLDRDVLLEDTKTLSQLFALLVLAHYQTQPADLRYLLDARDVHLYVVRYRGNIVAAALLEAEGGFDAELAASVYANVRRVRGHLLAQSLAAYVGLQPAPQLKYMRVMRIAVHPLAQQQGLGTFLLQHIEKNLKDTDVDLWGASFGATPELIHFWRHAGFSPVHLGLSRNAASGMHAALMLKPLSGRGGELLREAQLKFNQHFPLMLSESYNDLEPPLVRQLFGSEVTAPWYPLSEQDWLDVKSFVSAARGYEVNSVPIWKLVCLCLADKSGVTELAETEWAVLISKVLQKKPWRELVSRYAFSGQKEAVQRVRLAVKKLYDCCAPN
ncbi:MAG: GNAT family N-acetyltransferase [Gammaproteobacteria bacterium]